MFRQLLRNPRIKDPCSTSECVAWVSFEADFLNLSASFFYWGEINFYVIPRNSKNLFWRIKSDPGLFRVSLLMTSRSKFAKMHISSYSVTGWLKSCNNLTKHLKYQKDNSSWQLYALFKNLTNRLESGNHYNPWVNAGIWQDGENYNSLITIKKRLRVVIPVFLSGKTSWFTIMLCVSISDLVSSCTSLSVS